MKLMHFPISFRKGGPNDQYGIWFSYSQGQRDLLVDPDALCSCLGYDDGNELEYYTPFILEDDDDPNLLPFVCGKIDYEERMMTWEIREQAKDGDKSVYLEFDLYAVYSEIEDSIAALYNRFVILGCETAYDEELSLSDMGEIMVKMLSRMHPCCRETTASMIFAENFDLSFKETGETDSGGKENLLELTALIGHRKYNYTVNRRRFDFKRLRHDLENFIYHDEVHLEIMDDNGRFDVVINMMKILVVDETIPLNAGAYNRFIPILFVSVEERFFDEIETKLFGFCDVIPTLKRVYDTISDIAGYYAERNDNKEPDAKDVWQEDFMSKDFVSYLQSKKRELHEQEAYIRNNYANAEAEEMVTKEVVDLAGALEERED